MDKTSDLQTTYSLQDLIPQMVTMEKIDALQDRLPQTEQQISTCTTNGTTLVHAVKSEPVEKNHFTSLSASLQDRLPQSEQQTSTCTTNGTTQLPGGTTQLPVKDETLVKSEPVEKDDNKSKPRRRRKRLAVDKQIDIDLKEMKNQLLDTSDITLPLDLAPPTKKLMSWKLNGSADKLFQFPARAFSSQTAIDSTWSERRTRKARNQTVVYLYPSSGTTETNHQT